MSFVFPAMKLKRGEIEGLLQCERSVAGELTPLFDVARPSSRTSIDDRIEDSISLLRRGWPRISREFFLDLRDLDLDSRLQTGVHPLLGIARRLGFHNVKAVHCFGFDRDAAYEEAFVQVLSEHPVANFALRLDLEDLKMPEVSEERMVALMRKIGRVPQQGSVFLDLRTIHEATDDLVAIVTRMKVRLEKYGYRRTILLSSAMWDHSLIKTDKVTRVPRADVALWEHLRKSGVDVSYGDYGVITPSFADPDKDVIPAPKFRYTTPSSWLVSKGERPRKNENSQYPRLARRLLATGEFRHNDLGWGHEQLKAFAEYDRKSTDHAGAVAIDTCNHLEVTVRQLEVFERNHRTRAAHE